MSENRETSLESTISTDIFIHDIFPDSGLASGNILHYSSIVLDNHINATYQQIDRQSVDGYLDIQTQLDAILIDLIDPIQYGLFGSSNTIPPLDSVFYESVPCRLTSEVFDEIVPTHRMSKLIRKKYNIKEAVCSICQEDINSRQNCSILKCEHIYHKMCIKTWLTKTCDKPTCPCCRMDIRYVDDTMKQ